MPTALYEISPLLPVTERPARHAVARRYTYHTTSARHTPNSRPPQVRLLSFS